MLDKYCQELGESHEVVTIPIARRVSDSLSQVYICLSKPRVADRQIHQVTVGVSDLCCPLRCDELMELCDVITFLLETEDRVL